MTSTAENAQAVIDAYGGVYPVHPDADVDHRRCLAMALCKAIELVFKDMPVEEFGNRFRSVTLPARFEVHHFAETTNKDNYGV